MGKDDDTGRKKGLGLGIVYGSKKPEQSTDSDTYAYNIVDKLNDYFSAPSSKVNITDGTNYTQYMNTCGSTLENSSSHADGMSAVRGEVSGDSGDAAKAKGQGKKDVYHVAKKTFEDVHKNNNVHKNQLYVINTGLGEVWSKDHWGTMYKGSSLPQPWSESIGTFSELGDNPSMEDIEKKMLGLGFSVSGNIGPFEAGFSVGLGKPDGKFDPSISFNAGLTSGIWKKPGFSFNGGVTEHRGNITDGDTFDNSKKSIEAHNKKVEAYIGNNKKENQRLFQDENGVLILFEGERMVVFAGNKPVYRLSRTSGDRWKRIW